jgi:hypothetical protein
MQRHNLSREGVLNTINDLQTIGYANAVSGEPINTPFVSGNKFNLATGGSINYLNYSK